MVTSNSTWLVSRTVRTPTSPTWGRWVAAAAVLVLAVGVGTVYVVTTRPPSHHRGPALAVAPPRHPVLKALTATAPAPSATGVATALASALRDRSFGGHLTGEVVDGVTGTVLLDRGAAQPLPPASTVKVLTATAALETLGPAATLNTGVVRDGSTLYLIGGGDVTLRSTATNAAPAYPPAADLTSLAGQTVSALGSTRSVRLCLDTSAWAAGPAQAPGWSPGYFTAGDIAHLSPLEVDEGAASLRHPARAPIARVADPTAAAGAAFAAALRRQGVAVSGARCRASAPPSALGIASVSSAPISALVQRMLTVSDNDLAESLGRAVARHEGQTADFIGEASAVTNVLRSLGVDVSGLTLYDASGLSHLDRISAHALVQVVQLAVSRPNLRVVLAGMPVAGLTGTLASRYRHGPAAAAAGVARAKTGTLAGVNTVTGYLVDADGRGLVFAFLTDRAAGPDATEAALDRLVARLVGCGCA